MSANELSWGQLNGGQRFGVLALDIDRAIASAGFRDYEHILVQHVRERSWGEAVRRKKKEDRWPDPLPCVIDIPALAAELEVPAQRLYEARTRLLAGQVFKAIGAGLTINKDASKWTEPDGVTPRLSPGRLRYAMAARTSPRTSAPSEPTAESNAKTESRCNAETESDDKSNAKAEREQRQNGIKATPKRNPPVGERAGEEKKENTLTQSPSPEEGFPRVVTYETADGQLLPVKGDIEPSSADVARVAKVANGLFPRTDISAKAQQFCSVYPAEWIVAAMEATAATGPASPSWNYVWKILKRYQGQDGPDRAKASSHGGGYRHADPPLPPVVDMGLTRKRDRGPRPSDFGRRRGAGA